MLEPENASPRSKSADPKFSSSKFADSKFANPLATSRSGALEPSPWYRTRSTISIAINYYQTLTILTKHTNLPSLVASIMEVAKLTNISKGGVGLECVGPFFRPFTASYSIIVLQPLLIVLGVLLIYGTGKLVIRFLTDLHQDLTGTYWAIICTHVILFFFNFLFMPLSTYILSVFPCAKDPLTGIEYLAIEPHLSCHVIPLAGKIIPLIFDMIALYVLFCSLLAWYQVTLGDTKFFLLHSFGFFFDHFKPEWVWMSIFILTRRLLHAITMGFTSSDTSFVPVVNVIIIAISIMCISLAKPYRQKLDNISEILSMVVLVVVYMIAIVISQFGQNELISVFYVINIGMTIWFVILLAVGYQHYWVRFVPHRVRALVPSIKPRGKKKAKKSKMDVTLSDFSSSTPKETQNGTAL